MRFNKKIIDNIKINSVYEGSQAQKDARKSRADKLKKSKEASSDKKELSENKPTPTVTEVKPKTTVTEVKTKTASTDEVKPKTTPRVKSKKTAGETEVKPKLMDNLLVNDIKEVVDPEKEEKQNYVEKKMYEQTAHTPNWLVGLAPLAMGALIGDISTGATVGGNNLMEQYRHTLKDEDTNLAYDRKMAAVKSKSDSGKFQIYNKGGIPTFGKGEELRGKQAMSPTMERGWYNTRLRDKVDSKVREDIARGTNLKLTKDSLGREYFANRQKPDQKIYLEPTINLSQEQQKLIDKVSMGLAKEVDFGTMSKYRELASSLERLSSANDKGESNELAGKDALKQYIKRTEGGRLTDFDVEFMQYMFGQEKYKARLEEFMSGRMNSGLRSDLMAELASELQFKKKEIKRKYNVAYRRGLHRGISPSKMAKYIGAPIGLFDNAVVEFKNSEGKRVETVMPMDEYQNALANGASEKVLGVTFE